MANPQRAAALGMKILNMLKEMGMSPRLGLMTKVSRNPEFRNLYNADLTSPEMHRKGLGNVEDPEQLKKLEDRKLVEDADLQIARDLFSNEEEEFALEENRNDNKNFYKKNIKSEKKVSNQKVNEQKQKEEAKFVKEENAKKTKAKELYGYTEYDAIHLLPIQLNTYDIRNSLN